jgi:hypothetical protein
LAVVDGAAVGMIYILRRKMDLKAGRREERVTKLLMAVITTSSTAFQLKDKERK